MYLFLATNLLPFSGLAQGSDPCAGLEVRIEVDRNQTSCKNPNGKLTARLYRNGAEVKNLRVNYYWYPGDAIDPSNTSSAFAGGSSVDKLDAGNYGVVAIVDGCSSESVIYQATATVEDETPQIVILEYFDDPATFDSTGLGYPLGTTFVLVNEVYNVLSCVNEPRGVIRLWQPTVDGKKQNYKIQWFNGIISVPDKALQVPKFQSLDYMTDIPRGTYTLFATDDETGCYSDPYYVFVDGDGQPPSIEAIVIHNTLCSGYNSSLTIDVLTTVAPGVEPLNGYNLKYFAGADTTGTPIADFPVGQIPAVSSPITLNLAPGTYTFLITNLDTDPGASCKTVISYEILSQTIPADITATTTPNSICSPATPNGTITATVTYNGNPVNYTNYTVYYQDINGGAATSFPAGSNEANGIAAGSYQVWAESGNGECNSDPITVTVAEALPSLTLDLTSTPQTSCDGTPNGSITATATSSTGNMPSVTVVNSSNTTITDLSAVAGNETYTVTATDVVSGCTTTSSIFVASQEADIAVSIEVFPNRICDPNLAGAQFSGYVNVTSVSFNGVATTDYTGYEFVWYKNGSVVSGESGNLLDNLEESTYAVKAIRTDLGCESPLVEAVVEANLEAPVITYTSTDQRACDPALSNGNLTFTINLSGTDVTANYQYFWFEGTDTNGASFIGGDGVNSQTNLSAGYYTIQAVNTNTGCIYEASGYVNETLVYPEVSLTVNDIFDCINPTQSIEVQAVLENGAAANLADYTFAWYAGDKAQGTALTETGTLLNTQNGSALLAGYYTVVATKTTTGCSAEAVTAYLPPPPPQFDIVITINDSPSSCNTNGGILEAYVNESGTPTTAGYTFEWYRGYPINPTSTYYTNPQVTFSGSSFASGTIVNNLTLGIYSIVVTNSSGCKEVAYVELPFQNAHSAVVITPINAETCGGTGGFQVEVTDLLPHAPNQSDYLFIVKDLYGNIIDQKTGEAPNTTFTGLDPGIYTVVAQDITGVEDDCSSIEDLAEIKQVAQAPTATIESITPNTVCNTTYNGAFTLNFSASEYEPGAFDYVTTQVQVSYTGPVSGGPTMYSLGDVDFTGLPAGEYTFQIEGFSGAGTSTNCTTNLTVNIPNRPQIPQLVAQITSNQTECNPNGAIEITSILLEGASQNAADYNIYWNGVVETYLSSSTLPAGKYTLYVEDKISGCVSPPVVLDILDESIQPGVSITSTPNNDCDPNDLTGNGNLTFTFTDITFPFTYQIVNNTTTSWTSQSGSSSTPTLTLNNLPGGNYTITVQDTRNCQLVADANVAEVQSVPVITQTSFTNDNSCSVDNGTVGVVSVSYNSVEETGADLSNYQFTWTNLADGTTFTGISSANLAAGNYQVIAVRQVSPGLGCTSAPVTVTVSETLVYLSGTLVPTPNSACDATQYNGTLTLGLENVSGLNFNWTLESLTTGVTFTQSGPEANYPTSAITGLAAAEYQLTINPSNGCSYTTTATIGDRVIEASMVLSAEPQTYCTPNARIDVEELIFDGVRYSRADYASLNADFNFVLYDNNNTATTVTVPVTDLSAGSYQLAAVKKTGEGAGCEHPVMTVSIEEYTQRPMIQKLSSQLIVECFNDVGSLALLVDGNPSLPADHTATWKFYESTQTFANAVDYTAGTNQLALTNLDAGIYWVRIDNTVTGCWDSISYEISRVEVNLDVSASANNQTYCDPANGEIFARIANLDYIKTILGEDVTFSYEAFYNELGTYPGGTAQLSEPNTEQLFVEDIAGTQTYTVFAYFYGTDPNTTTCIAIDTVEVLFEEIKPEPTLTAVEGNMFCKPELGSNGTAYALVNGTALNYEFRWYEGDLLNGTSTTPEELWNNITDPADYIAGDYPETLYHTKYTVLVKDNISGCIGSDTVSIVSTPPEIPFSSASLSKTVTTSCKEPNGTLSVQLNNNADPANYVVEWYAGTEVLAANLITDGLQNSGFILTGVDMGDYTVRVQDVVTGCWSDTLPENMTGDYIYPKFEVLVEPATCSKPGSAEIIDLNGQTVTTIVYAEDGSVADLNDLTAGTYTVEATTDEGCSISDEFTVDDVVKPYSGLTLNGDGQNDYFHIDCIDLFENNLVRIYNRAGGLVYETRGYDNNVNVFTGVGNRGLYIGGKELPVGTYYYVVFKENKEKPTTGFLEIIR